MNEQLRNEFLVSLSLDFNKEDSEKILHHFDLIMQNYNIELKKNKIVNYNNELPEMVNTYLICKQMSGLAESTLKNYKLILRRFFTTVQQTPEKITANNIREFLYNYQQQKQISRRTLDKYREYINRFFTWATEEGYLQINPSRNISPIKYEEKPREALTQLELEYLRQACTTNRERAILEVLYSTGARVSELIQIKKSDINWYDRSVHLYGKGRKHRTSFLNAKAEVALNQYLETRKDKNDYLFVSVKSPYHNLTKDAIEKIIRNISKKAFEHTHKKVTTHILRHTTATTALQSGMPIVDISKLLGHESIDTTMIYAKTSLEDVQSGHRKHII